MRSTTHTSGRSKRSLRRPLVPSSAHSTSKPEVRRWAPIALAMTPSSSITSTAVIPATGNSRATCARAGGDLVKSR